MLSSNKRFYVERTQNMATKKSKKESVETVTEEVQSEVKLHTLGDETIGLIREILQLTLYTGTNIIDHLRAVRLVESANGKLVPDESYVEAYNKMVEDFAERTRQMAAEAQKATGAQGTLQSN